MSKRIVLLIAGIILAAVVTVLVLSSYSHGSDDPYVAAVRYAAKYATSVQELLQPMDERENAREAGAGEARALAQQLLDGLGGNAVDRPNSITGAGGYSYCFLKDSIALFTIVFMSSTDYVYLRLPDHTTETDEPYIRTNGQFYQFDDRGALARAIEQALKEGAEP